MRGSCIRSDSIAKARSISGEGSVSKYAAQSVQVKAFSVPPRLDTSLLISPVPKRLPPLKSTCSTQCEAPVLPGSSATRWSLISNTLAHNCLSLEYNRWNDDWQHLCMGYPG